MHEARFIDPFYNRIASSTFVYRIVVDWNSLYFLLDLGFPPHSRGIRHADMAGSVPHLAEITPPGRAFLHHRRCLALCL